MSVQSVALASLTATYTDSEGDEGLDEEQQRQEQHSNHHRHAQRRRDTSLGPCERDEGTENSRLAGHRRVTSNAESPLFGVSPGSSPDDAILGRLTSPKTNNHRYRNEAIRREDKRPAKRAKPTLVTDVTSKVHRLVSYFDDSVVSDDEMGTASVLDENAETFDENDATALTGKRNEAAAQSPKRQGELFSDNENGEEREDGGKNGDYPDEINSWGVTIPPEPVGQCPAELQEKIANLYRKMENGLDMNLHIQQRKEFRNPSIYEKLIQFCSINEMGTNYPPDRFDPFKWGKDSYYEELARIQKNEMDKLEKARKEKTKIEIVTGTAKRPSNNASNAEDEAKRRKSKWDQVATGTSTTVKTNVVVSQPTLTTLTSSATGTKATVISAFGSLPKKRL